GDRVLIDTLPDGSIITLNKHATLAYAKNFNTKTRNVTLTGEAFFIVSPNKQKPFNIAVNDVQVHVVGTSFNIKSDSRQTEVIVETGIVDVGVAEQKVKVLPNQKILVKKHSSKLRVEANRGELYNYYRTKTFYCSNTPLYQLADALSNAYSTKIIVAKNVSNLPLDAVYQDMQLDAILSLISTSLNVKIEQRNDTIFIK
ncbi:MAG: FecR family protein, partial [Sphingobacteriales bacterium]